MPSEIEKLRKQIRKTITERETISHDAYGAIKAIDLLAKRDDLLRQAARTLSQPEVAGAGVRVKALRWEDISEYEHGWWTAQVEELPLGYEVRINSRDAVRVRFPGKTWETFDGTADEAKAAAQADFERRILSALSTPQPTPRVSEDGGEAWHKGEPPKPWRNEWFIALTTYEDRVVLRALPEEYTYDYTTADQTYIKADKIKAWMQFPDSEFVAPPSDEAAKLREEVERLTRERDEARNDAGHWQLNAEDMKARLEAAEARLAQAERPVVTEAARALLDQWKAFEGGYGNMEEAYYKLAKSARPHWMALEAALQPQEQGR